MEKSHPDFNQRVEMRAYEIHLYNRMKTWVYVPVESETHPTPEETEQATQEILADNSPWGGYSDDDE